MMRRYFPALLASALLLAAPGIAHAAEQVEVTRFHAEDISALGKGTIAIEPASGVDPANPDWRAFRDAVMAELKKLGYSEAVDAPSGQVLVLGLSRQIIPVARSSSVGVGVGGSTGSYGSGLGLGIGINLSPRPKPRIDTDLSASIRERTGGQTLWEARANMLVSSKSALAEPSAGAAKMARALFQGFPGASGETIQAK